MNLSLHSILESREYQAASRMSKLVFALGQDETGQVRFCDLAQAGHILIGGSTGSGKSMFLHCLIASIITLVSPSDVQFMIAAGSDLEGYNGIPHLLRPVATDREQAISLLSDAITEMDRRYQLFSQADVHNFESYQKVCMERKAHTELVALPAMVLIIDGLDYQMMTTLPEDEMKEKIGVLLRRATAHGIYLVMTAQHPSDDLLPGFIKVTMPAGIARKLAHRETAISTRIAFKVGNFETSMMILRGRTGAEQLDRCGDMLYLPPNAVAPSRIQGAFMAETDITSLVLGLRGQ